MTEVGSAVIRNMLDKVHNSRPSVEHSLIKMMRSFKQEVDACGRSVHACASNARELAQHSHGFAMIVPLVTLAVIGGLLTTALATSRSTARHASALEGVIQAELLSESGIRRLLTAFSGSADDLPQTALGRDVGLKVGDHTLLLRIEPEAGKIDVLKSDEVLLQQYVSTAGTMSKELWSQFHEQRRAGDGHGALRTFDLALSGAKSIDQLRRDLTCNGAGGIDPQYASTDVLGSIPDISPGQAAAIAAIPVGERASAAGASRYFSVGGRTFSLVTSIETHGKKSGRAELPIELSTTGQVIALAGVRR